MKCAFFVLVASLAALALAAPPGSARRDIELSTNPHFAAQTTHGHLAKLSNLTTWTSLNGTTSGTNAANFGKYGVALRMGPDRQHVGTLRGQRLYNAIFNCLNHLHPWDVDNYCSGETDSAGSLPVCEWSTCRINNIVYNDNLHGTPKYIGGNAYLEMKMWWPYVREKRNAKADKDLRKLTYEIIAGSYRKITEQEANCYLVHFPGSRATKFCMIPKQFLVAFPTTSDVGNVRNAVKIDIAFNGKSEGGNWDCPRSVEPVNGEFLYRFRGPLSKLLSWDEHEINPEAMCATDDCLNWYDADPDGPWKEDPKCKLPDFKIHD